MQRFERLATLEGADVMSAVELARLAQGQRFAKLQAPPIISGTGGCDPHHEPEPEPELEPEVIAEPIAVPVGPAIGFTSPGMDCRDEGCGYVGMHSGGPAYVQTLETGELGARELQQFRLQFGAAVVAGKAGVDSAVSPLTHCEDRSDAGSTRSSPGDAPDLPQQLLLHEDSDDSGGYASEDDKRSRTGDASEIVWRKAW